MNKQHLKSGFRLWLLSFLVVGCGLWSGANFVRAQSTPLSCPWELLLEVQSPSTGEALTAEDLAAVEQVLQQRLNAMQIPDARIELQEGDRIVIILPPGSDPEQVARVLSATAQLEFRAQIPGTEAQLRDRFLERAMSSQQANNEAELAKINAAIAQLFTPTQLTGQNVESAIPQVSSSSSWEIYLEFDGEGAQTFAEITKNLAGTGRAIGIFLDNVLISAPIIDSSYANTGILGGKAVIAGNFTVEQAKDLAAQLHSGQLPFSANAIASRQLDEGCRY